MLGLQKQLVYLLNGGGIRSVTNTVVPGSNFIHEPQLNYGIGGVVHPQKPSAQYGVLVLIKSSQGSGPAQIASPTTSPGHVILAVHSTFEEQVMILGPYKHLLS